jgi:hypothetical protein
MAWRLWFWSGLQLLQPGYDQLVVRHITLSLNQHYKSHANSEVTRQKLFFSQIGRAKAEKHRAVLKIRVLQLEVVQGAQ